MKKATFYHIPVEEFDAPGFTNDSMFISQAQHFINNWKSSDTQQALLSAGYSLAIIEAARLSMINGKVENITQSFKHNY